MSDIPRIPESLPLEVLAYLGSMSPRMPPVEDLSAIDAAVNAVAASLPDGKKGFVKISYDYDQFGGTNEVGVAFVHKFRENVSTTVYAGYDWGERRGATVRAELVWEWD